MDRLTTIFVISSVYLTGDTSHPPAVFVYIIKTEKTGNVIKLIILSRLLVLLLFFIFPDKMIID